MIGQLETVEENTVKGGQAKAVAVFGAGGHTGRFVMAELTRRGIAPMAVVRSAATLQQEGVFGSEIDIREAGIDDDASLDRAFAGVDAVINCAGPFLDTARPVAAAAIRAGAHYLDVTAEQPSAMATFETFDEAARNAGVLILPAMGFYGGFGDLLVTAAAGGWTDVDDIRIAIALDTWHPTKGTRITGERNTAQRLVVSNGSLVPLVPAADDLEMDFPEPFGRQNVVALPFSEIPVITRHLRPRELHSFLNRAALRDVRDAATPAPKATDETGRSPQRFAIDAAIRKGGETRRIAARGRDIYAFSAPLICEAVERLLDGRSRGSGARAPGAVFEAGDFLDALSAQVPDFELIQE
ncbi:saccharopine dehydrogenase NADP-binding domain-containing protein [Nitratireductor rhodophyticola]|uniref:saccharopine dehydrogenase family protein n=1 Tax=Nitratireductor rhodophyticola TaxID=2854036 RepID=UPI002AC9EE0E|nr:saccharopine dehydrogenase NADP-binding domain-containing protein [Nitratireductor rhodophyticola]WPZ13975.1 saccharopine dehydrogenase NADP-binding domain-containing protein [Nitratireductor rhodophyticola]